MSSTIEALREAGARAARGESVGEFPGDPRAVLREASRGWEALVDRATELREALDEDSTEARDEAVSRAFLAALRARDEAELLRVGAESLGAGDEDLDPEGAAALHSFDELLRPALWKLLGARAQSDEVLSPWERVRGHHRARFWWHFEAREVPAHALDALPAVALLVARFPEAEEALRGLVRARGAWVAAGREGDSSRPVATVTTLAAWAARRRRAAQRPDHSFALAAADVVGAEQTVFSNESVECSMRGDRTLLVDVIAERDAAVPPSLERAGVASSARAGSEVQGAVERFSFSLTDEELASPGGVCLRVRARDGREVLVRLPEDAER